MPSLLKCHSDFSLFQENSFGRQFNLSAITVDGIAKQASLHGYTSVALTDYSSVSGVPQFIAACKSSGIKPLIGCNFYLPNKSTVITICKNFSGWVNLYKLISDANTESNYKGRPTIPLEALARKENISITGHIGSEIANNFFVDYRAAYAATSYDEAKSLVRPDWEKQTINVLDLYKQLFGDDLYISVQPLHQMPAAQIFMKAMRWLAPKHKLKLIGCPDVHYAQQTDHHVHRILLCSTFNGITLKNFNSKITQDDLDDIGKFFRADSFYIPDASSFLSLLTQHEIDNIEEINQKCESFNLSSQPEIPDYPGCDDPNKRLVELCREGWKKLSFCDDNQKKIYVDRVKYELQVLQDAGLSSYFLIVQDYFNFAKSQGWLVSPRGSSLGSLVSYLLGIGDIDPIKYNLIFERFYNPGRKSSLPDVDGDFPVEHRDEVCSYIKQRFKPEYTGHMITFGRMKGRAALKDVLRITEKCSFAEMNLITKHIPDESKISDQLQEMEDPSIIKWALINHSKALSAYCVIKENGELDGEYAEEFKYAIKLSGINRATGKHAGGIVIGRRPLYDCCPLVRDKGTGEPLPAFEMEDIEKIGLVKYDILGCAALDKIAAVVNDIRNGCDDE